jgi:hypothetical protein
MPETKARTSKTSMKARKGLSRKASRALRQRLPPSAGR